MSSLLALEETHLARLNNVERRKHIQKLKIVKHLYVKGAKTNADICSRFAISSPTSIAILNELVAEGLVEKQGRGKSLGGRKPELYGLRDGSLFVLSIHIEQFKTRIAIFDNNNHIVSGLHSFSIELTRDLGALAQIHAHAQALLLASGIELNKLVGVGVSMPGLVASKEGNNHTYLLTGGTSESLQQLLEEQFGKPVFIQNDAKSAALAEYRFGLAHGLRDALVLSMDWGIGLGIILDGKLRSGALGFAGEFGHIPLVDGGALCHCGKRGCLETMASGSAIVRLAKAGIRAGQRTLLSQLTAPELDQLESEQVYAAAHEGDQFAINTLAEVGTNLGKGIAILIQLFNPELIILGGKIAQAKQFIFPAIQQAINTYCMAQLREKTTVVVSELGDNAVVLGSVATVMENIFESYLELA
ncbi:ROK family transcriptional regulator [Hymenobacter sp. BRD128]|uniref:ROK family protein n=1 Tax=Hymenobacter sp. BRD128 TaxID=2675878 RepID=UPI0015675D4E|nr:ROK family protein [Hymenobacter sp. BRD128]QKG57762.1 ROK family transcriptional regulator [Hymenobacter sp. BRD128]